VHMFLLKMNSVCDDVGSPEVSHNIEFFGSMDTIIRQMVGSVELVEIAGLCLGLVLVWNPSARGAGVLILS